MDTFLFQLLRTLVFIASTYGIGSFASKYLNKDEDGHAYVFAIGIVIWLVIGGPLVALSLASQNTLVLLLLSGLGLFFWHLAPAIKNIFFSDASSFRSYSELENSVNNKYWSSARIINWLFTGLVFLLLCTLVLYLLPSAVMKHHDDFGLDILGALEEPVASAQRSRAVLLPGHLSQDAPKPLAKFFLHWSRSIVVPAVPHPLPCSA